MYIYMRGCGCVWWWVCMCVARGRAGGGSPGSRPLTCGTEFGVQMHNVTSCARCLRSLWPLLYYTFPCCVPPTVGHIRMISCRPCHIIFLAPPSYTLNPYPLPSPHSQAATICCPGYAGDNGQLALRGLARSTLASMLPKLETRGALGGARWRLVGAPSLPSLLALPDPVASPSR